MASTTDGEFLRTDTRGRVHLPKERKEALLAEFDRSGLSAVAFTKVVGVNYGTFAGWLQKRRKASQAEGGEKAGSGPLRLIEAVPEPIYARNSSGGETGLCVELPGGAQARVESEREIVLLAELLRRLSRGGDVC